MSLIELERVRYRYEDAAALALDDVNLKIKAGEFVLLAGASGSGKSTLCRLLNGLIPHFHGGALEGAVRVEGSETREHPVRELFARVGLVFQNPEAQLFNSTVEREIAFGLESLGLPRVEIGERVAWALRVAHLQALRDRAPHALSGGEAQAVAIAAILALRPRVLVLDELFAHLDPEAVERGRAILRQAHAEGTTVIAAEHRLHATLQDATRVVVLDHGRVVHDGAPRRVLSEDVSSFRLNVPFVVHFARESGWKDIPLSVDEALGMATERGADPSLTLPPSGIFDLARGSDGVSTTSAALGRQAEAPSGGVEYPNASRVIEFSDVSFSREGREILHHVELDVARGECVALIGKNGSGKTTILKHLNALYRPTRGMVRVLGRDTRQARVSDLAAQVGLVFQNPNDQLFKPNVREEIEVAPRALRRFDRAWIDRLCAQFELGPLLDRSPFTISEGEKKRVMFAAALAARPEIIALDEPTTGQDSVFRSALTRLLDELLAQGTTVLLATHDLEFAEQVAPRWIALADGQTVADGLAGAVMQNGQAMARAALVPTPRFRLENALSVTRRQAAALESVE